MKKIYVNILHESQYKTPQVEWLPPGQISSHSRGTASDIHIQANDNAAGDLSEQHLLDCGFGHLVNDAS